MPFEGKPFDAINEGDLQELIRDQVREQKTIDYKEALPGHSDKDKREFLADVSSFANAAGGFLVYGMKEDAGIPVDLCGLGQIDADHEILRLDSVARTGIAPRIPGFSIWPVQLADGSAAIIVRIPRSYAAPHMVTFQESSRFYSRNSAGKYPLDVGELRVAFLRSETAADRIRSFRIERLSNIIAGETPAPLKAAPRIILHIIPFSAFEPTSRFDLSSLAHERARLAPISGGGWSQRYNLDGLLTWTTASEPGVAESYLQVFRTGAIEAVNTQVFGNNGSQRFISSPLLEKALLEAVPRFLGIQKSLGVDVPFVVMLSLIGVRGYRLAVDNESWWLDRYYPLERDSLLLPEALADLYECDAADLLRPMFDTLWNACGYERWMNYSSQGQRGNG